MVQRPHEVLAKAAHANTTLQVIQPMNDDMIGVEACYISGDAEAKYHNVTLAQLTTPPRAKEAFSFIHTFQSLKWQLINPIWCRFYKNFELMVFYRPR